MRWSPTKLGSAALLFGAFFAVCEAYGTYSYFLEQQGGLDYVVLIACGIAACVPLIPPLADVAGRLKWRVLAWVLWLALPLALIVVMASALQRTGSATDAAEKDRAKARAALELAKQTKEDAEEQIAKLGDVRALADIQTDLAKAKLSPLYGRSDECTDTVFKASRDLCARIAALEGEKAKAVDLTKHRKTVADARVKIAAGSGGSKDLLAYRVAGYTGGRISEDQVRLWQPLVIPLLASWLSGALLTFGMRMDFHIELNTPAWREPKLEPMAVPQRLPDNVTPLRPVASEAAEDDEEELDPTDVVVFLKERMVPVQGKDLDYVDIWHRWEHWCREQDPPKDPLDPRKLAIILNYIVGKTKLPVRRKGNRTLIRNRKLAE